MALYDKWTVASCRAKIRQELSDTAGRWWSDNFLNTAIEEWANELNSDFKLLWGTATTTTTATSLALPADALHFGRIYINGTFTPVYDQTRLAEDSYKWEYAYGPKPTCWWVAAPGQLEAWPTPYGTYTLIHEYPKKATVSVDSDVPPVPAWMRWSVVPFAVRQAYKALGPNHDPNKAARYNGRFKYLQQKYWRALRNIFPRQYPALKPGGVAEERLWEVKPPEGYNMAGTIITQSPMIPTTVTGTIDGSNQTFTIGRTGDYYLVILNGLVQQSTTDYTISTTTLTFVSAPPVGSSIQVWVSNPA